MKSINLFALPSPIKLCIFGLIGGVVFYLLYLWNISNLNEELVAEKKKQQEIEQQFPFVFAKQAEVKKQTSQFSKLEDTLKQWENKFLTYSAIPQLINDILKFGAANHLYFTLFTPGKEIKDGHYIKLPIKVIVVGNYNDTANFLSQIANLASIVIIGNFVLSSEEKNNLTSNTSGKLLTSEIVLEAYYIANTNEKKHV